MNGQDDDGQDLAPEHRQLMEMLHGQIDLYTERRQGVYRRVERVGVAGGAVPVGMLEVCRRLELPEPVVVRADEPPVLSLVVDAEQANDAFGRLSDVFRETGYWPLLVDGIEYEEEMPDVLWDHGDAIGSGAVAQARALHIDAVLDVSTSGSPDGAASPYDGDWLEIDNIGDEDPTGELLLVPVQHPAEAFAALGFGGYNTGWSPAEHSAVAGWLFQSLGALPTTVGNDRVGFIGSNSGHPLHEARTIAARLRRYCPDAVYEGDLEVIAGALTVARGVDLRFWWD